MNNKESGNLPRIGFFIGKGGYKFIDEIIANISKNYTVKKFIIDDYSHVVEFMEWADICWFEWCNNLIVYASKLKIAHKKIIICRLHRYEVFTEYPTNVTWENVDKLIIVTEHLKALIPVENIENLVPIEIIENGLDLEKFKYVERQKGFNIAFVADLILRKNPMFLLQIIRKLVDLDSRYKLFIAGQFNDQLTELYWNHQIKEMYLEDNVVFQGWHTDLDTWLEDKNYILSTSIHESFGYNIAEAMAKGIKPVIHNFIHAREIWPENYLFNTLDEAINAIVSDNYNSLEYRDFIMKNYSLGKELAKINNLFQNISLRKKTQVCTVNDNNDIIIFGASTLGKSAYEFLCRNNKIAFFCDNDSEKWGKTINNIQVISPEYLKENHENFQIMIASEHYLEISRQLRQMGIYNFRIFKAEFFVP